MRVAFVLPELRGGGIATYYRNLIPALIAAGHDVVTILADADGSRRDPSFPGEVLAVSAADLEASHRQLAGLDLFPSMRRRIALSYACRARVEGAGNFDVIECTDYNLNCYAFLTQPLTPTVVCLHGSSGQIEAHEYRTTEQIESVFLLLLEQALFSEATTVLAYSRMNQRYWAGKLPRGVDLCAPYLKLDDQPARTVRPDNRGVVVGRLQLWKGAVFLAQYYANHPSSPKIEWIGGDNYYREHNASMATYLRSAYPTSWGDQIRFVGKQDYASTQKAIAAAAFVLVPSLWDTLNFTAAEAMWQGKHVLISDGAGAADFVEHGVSGYVFRAGDAQSLNQAFDMFTSASPDERISMSARAMQSIRSQTSTPDVIERRVAVLERTRTAGYPELSAETRFIHNMLCANTSSTVHPVLRRQAIPALLGILREKLVSKF